MIGLAGIFPLILLMFGNPEVGVMASGYMGLAFLGVLLRGGRHALPVR